MDKLQAIQIVDSKLNEIISEDLPILIDIKKHLLESGGKRVRPLIHFYLGRILGYEGDQWSDVGAIGELIHAASLLHDDVVDESDMRRGKPSINAMFGNKGAVLGGDYLFSCALDHLRHLEHSVELLGVFTNVIKMLSVGELLQMRWESDIHVNEETYDRVIYGKTAVLFASMTETAALQARPGDNEYRKTYKEFGERLGRIFQIRDDYLDYFADEAYLGKKLYLDFERGIVTRPIIMLRDQMGNSKKEELLQLWGDEEFRKSDRGTESIVKLLEEEGIRSRMESELRESLGGLIKFMEEHDPSRFRESIIDQLQKLSV